MNASNLLTYGLLFGLLLLVIFIIREIVLWYYKINERVELQRQTLATLTEIRDLLDSDRKKSETSTSLNNPETMTKLEQHIQEKP